MSIGNYLTALDEQRDALARNLVTMGVQASETEKLNTLVPKVLQIPQTKPDVTLFRASIDALHDYGEKVYTFYNDGYRSLCRLHRILSAFLLRRERICDLLQSAGLQLGADHLHDVCGACSHQSFQQDHDEL